MTTLQGLYSSFWQVSIKASQSSITISMVCTLEESNSRFSYPVSLPAAYHGLDKISLNNLIQDNTMMKDYLTYHAVYILAR